MQLIWNLFLFQNIPTPMSVNKMNFCNLHLEKNRGNAKKFVSYFSCQNLFFSSHKRNWMELVTKSFLTSQISFSLTIAPNHNFLVGGCPLLSLFLWEVVPFFHLFFVGGRLFILTLVAQPCALSALHFNNKQFQRILYFVWTFPVRLARISPHNLHFFRKSFGIKK